MKNPIAIIVNPFSHYAGTVPEIPASVQKYIDAEAKTEGTYFRLVKDGKSENTGDGMSYYDRLQVFVTGKENAVQDTGYRMWRNGRAFSTDQPELSISDVKIVEESAKRVIYGYRNGIGEILIAECFTTGQKNQVARFNMANREAILKNQVGPDDQKSFEKWVYRHINTGSTHVDEYYNDENICVLLARHCSRSVDATHDWYQLFVWKKGEGVAMGSRTYTRAATSYTKFSTNYLRSKVSIGNDGEILLEGESQFGDVSVSEVYKLETKAVEAV